MSTTETKANESKGKEYLTSIYISASVGFIIAGVFILGFLIGRAEGRERIEQRREDRTRPDSYSVTPISPAVQDGAGEYEEKAEGGQDQD